MTRVHVAKRWVALSVCLIVCLAASVAASAQSIPGEQQQQYAARMKWWKDARFGWFICWGPCSLMASEIGWSRNGPRPGIGVGEGGIPMDVYDNLYKRFNPTQFDAKAWVDAIKKSGAKYMIFLTRHHDGFSMFDTQYSDYKITNTPFGRDVCAELAKACHEAGIKIIWYYSQPDWHNPDYLTEHQDRFIKYLQGQVRELLTKYGKIDGMWFDGLQGTAKDWDSERLVKMIHELQPGIIINNRAGVPGDFGTPEQVIGAFDIKNPWETCITQGTGWSWTGSDAPVKSYEWCIDTLVRCAGGGGNLALDTGPMPDGRIDPRQIDNYMKMGQWLGKYGVSIYETTGGPWRPGPWGAAARKGDTIYLHVLAWPERQLRLPPIEGKIVACRALTGGTPTFRQGQRSVVVNLPAQDRDKIDTIIALTVDGSAGDIPAESQLPPGALTLHGKASASSVWSEGYTADKAFDGDTDTRWGAAPGSRSGWLQVDLGKPMAISQVVILEEPWNRVRKYQLQYQDGNEWRTFHEGTTLGDLHLRFPQITAQVVRLNILEAVEVPTIWEFALYGPSQRPGRLVTAPKHE